MKITLLNDGERKQCSKCSVWITQKGAVYSIQENSIMDKVFCWHCFSEKYKEIDS